MSVVRCPAESRLAPARRCAECGVSFQPIMRLVWNGKGQCCSTRCRSLWASKCSRERFVPGLNSHLKDDAQRLLLRAVAAGELVRPSTCSKCESTDVEAHHPDYAKPLEVLWLCPKCHRAEHYPVERNAEKGGRQPNLKRALKRIAAAVKGGGR